jgi:hypothetical protein
LYCASHFARHTSFDWEVGEGACEGLFSCADAGIIKDSASPNAKDDILIMRTRPHPVDGILRLSPRSSLRTTGDKEKLMGLALEFARLQAGEARGFPFSTA